MISIAKILDALFWWRRRSGFKLADFFSWTALRIYLGIILFFNILAWIGAYYIYRHLSQELTILHANVDFGTDLIGNRIQVFTIPELGLLLFVLDFLLLFLFAKNPHFKFISHLLLSALVCAQFFLLLALIAVYLFNFS